MKSDTPPFLSAIGNEETAQLPAARFPGEIVVVDDVRAIRAACAELAAEPVIGFDTETRPSFRPGVHNRVALLQLSTPRRCFLFRSPVRSCGFWRTSGS